MPQEKILHSFPQISALVTFSPPLTFISQSSAGAPRKVVESGVYDAIIKRYQITTALGLKSLQFYQVWSVVLGFWEVMKLKAEAVAHLLKESCRALQ